MCLKSTKLRASGRSLIVASWNTGTGPQRDSAQSTGNQRRSVAPGLHSLCWELVRQTSWTVHLADLSLPTLNHHVAGVTQRPHPTSHCYYLAKPIAY